MSSQPPVPGHLFQGYDTFTSGARLATDAVTGDFDSLEGITSSGCIICLSQEAVQTAVGVSASMSSLFDFGAADARMSFIDTFNMTSTSVTVAVYSSVTSLHQQAKNTALASGITPPDPDTLNTFFQNHGDSFVSEFSQGAWYCALFVFYTETEEDQLSVAAQLSSLNVGEGGLSTVGLQAGLSSCQQAVKVKSSFNQKLMGFTNQPTPTVDNMVTFALNLPALTPINLPITFTASVTGYETVLPSPEVFEPIVNSRTLFAGGGPDVGIGASYAALSAIKKAIVALNAIYALYGYTDDPQMQPAPASGTTKASNVYNDVVTLYNLVQAIDADPTQPQSAPALLSDGTSPRLFAEVGMTPYVGGTGGGAFDEPIPAWVSAGVRLSSVTISGINHVHQISYQYQYGDGNETPTFTHGGAASSGPGVQTGPLNLNLPDGEQINSVLITSSWDSHEEVDAVAEIVIKTNQGHSIAAPGPDPGGTTWTPGANEAFLGFAGRAGDVLDALAIVSAVFQPAIWK